MAAGYAPAHNVFGNNVYHKIVWERLCKDGFRTVRKPPSKGVNEQMAFSEKGVKVRGVWLAHNTGLQAGEWRFISWLDYLECVVPGWGTNDVVVIDDARQPCILEPLEPIPKSAPKKAAKAASRPPPCPRCNTRMDRQQDIYVCSNCQAKVRVKGSPAAGATAPVARAKTPVIRADGPTAEEVEIQHRMGSC